MSYYSAYILNLLYINLLEWKSKEIISGLPITNSGFAGSKPSGGFMISSVKRLPGTFRELVVNSKLSRWNGSRGFINLSSIHWKGL